MPQNDIDKILEELKMRKAKAQSAKPVDVPQPVKETPIADKPVETVKKDVRISEKDKETLSRFINKSSEPEPEDHIQLVTVPDQNQYTSKKSDARKPLQPLGKSME